MKTVRVLVLLSTAMVLAACGGDDKKLELGGSCSLNSDCAEGLLCKFGACHKACVKSVDCAAGDQVAHAVRDDHPSHERMRPFARQHFQQRREFAWNRHAASSMTDLKARSEEQALTQYGVHVQGLGAHQGEGTIHRLT